MLENILQSLDGIEESDKMFYIKQGDGSFKLHDKIARQQEIVSAQKKQLATNTKKITDLEVKVTSKKEVEPSKDLQPGSSVTASKRELELQGQIDQLNKQISTIMDSNEKKETQLKQNKLQTSLKDACDKTGGIYELLKGVVKVDYDATGAVCVRNENNEVVLDDLGQPEKVDTFISSLKTNDVYKGAFRDVAPQGINMPNGQVNAPNQTMGKNFNELNSVHNFVHDKAAFVKAAIEKGNETSKQ